ADTDLRNSRTLLSLDEIYRPLEKCPANLRLLMADACRNDPFQSSKSRAVSDAESVTRPQSKAVPGGIAAFLACSKGQEAYESPRLKNGVFFHYVIEALRGAAVTPGTKEVTLNGLKDYVVTKVKKFVRETENQDQEPEMINRTRGLVTLVGGPDE